MITDYEWKDDEHPLATIYKKCVSDWKLKEFCNKEIKPRVDCSRKTGWRKWSESEVTELKERAGEYGFYPKFAKATGRSIRSVKGKARTL